jgi:hypothetical protein
MIAEDKSRKQRGFAGKTKRPMTQFESWSVC